MGLFPATPKLVFVEPVPLITIHSTGLAHVRAINGEMHFALFASQPSLIAEETENIINHRQAMPVAGVLEALPAVVSVVAEAMGLSAVEIVRKLVGRATAFH